jgi:hypothetical protein
VLGQPDLVAAGLGQQQVRHLEVRQEVHCGHVNSSRGRRRAYRRDPCRRLPTGRLPRRRRPWMRSGPSVADSHVRRSASRPGRNPITERRSPRWP